MLPPLAGISNADFGNAVDFSDGFHMAMVIAGVTLMAGGVLAWARSAGRSHAADARRTGPDLALRPRRPPLRVDCAEVA